MEDLIIIGGGPAGVSAALYAKARGLSIKLFEKDKIGGLIRNVSKVSHYTSVIVDEDGESFSKRLENQLNSANIQVIYKEIIKIEKTDEYFTVLTDSEKYMAKKVILATGSTPKELPLNLPKEVNISHWAKGYEEKVSNKTVIVNGGSDGAAKEAIYLSKFAKEVHIVQDQDKLLCIDEFKTQIENSDNIIVHLNDTLKEILVEDGKIIEAILNSKDSIISKNGIEVFAMIGQYPNSDLVKDLLSLENGFIKTDVKSQIDGLFIAGDIRIKPIRQVATAVSDGCIAGVLASK